LIERHVQHRKEKHAEHKEPAKPEWAAVRKEVKRKEQTEGKKQQQPSAQRLMTQSRLNEPETQVDQPNRFVIAKPIPPAPYGKSILGVIPAIGNHPTVKGWHI
jgi:hypothetical protein